MKTLGQKLRELRMKKNLSQKELAEKLGVKHTRYSNWENDKGSPNNELRQKLSIIFEVNVTYFLDNVQSVELYPVQDFGNKAECKECKEKDIIIEELRSKIKDKEMIINLLLKNSDPINKSAI